MASEVIVTLGGWGNLWRVGVLLESGGTFGKWGYFWKVGVLLESGGTFGELGYPAKL